MRHSSTHIKTDRLWLREIDESDTETIVRLRSNPSVYQYFLYPHKLTAEEHLQWYRKQYVKNNARVDWVAIDDEKGIVIGLYGVKKITENNAEISYLTEPDSQGKGYSKEAVTAIIRWTVNNWKLKEFIVTVHKDNVASIAFANKMGFCFERSDGDFDLYKMLYTDGDF